MSRLNHKSYDLLVAEVRRLSGSDPMLRVQRELAIKRLMRLRDQPGEPATEAEIRAAVDLFPGFDAKVMAQAVRLNRPPSGLGNVLKGLAIAGGTLGVLAGTVWLVNLPYPMIRRPVASVAPMLLLPSFMEMDHHYRQAIALVEQSDQLVNQATSKADIERGEEKVTAAQASLDKLPVWFLGYSPQRYCTFMSCSWQFTYDEFETARRQIGRMDAQIFQEEQAIAQYETAQVSLDNAKGLYATMPNQAEAIALWQGAIDDLTQIPAPTLAGRLAQTQLPAETRDFQQTASVVASEIQSETLFGAARAYGKAAVATAQGAPHPVEIWEKAQGEWEEAIKELGTISPGESGYLEAQKLRAEYTNQLGTVKVRLKQEQEAVTLFDRAQSAYTNLIATDFEANPRRYLSELQTVANQLQKVQAGTTTYGQAEQMQRQVSAMIQEANGVKKP